MKENHSKILIHTCCAICSGYPIEHLKELGYEPVAYFFNPNISPLEEYQKRLDSQKKLCSKLGCELIVENYSNEIYNEIMQGYENYSEGSERCARCFELRLLKTAFKAKELGIEHFDTSISISPHKNYAILKNLGEKFGQFFNINFLGLDYKKQDGFLKTNKIANSLQLYRQNYCGCEISMKRLKNLDEIKQ